MPEDAELELLSADTLDAKREDEEELPLVGWELLEAEDDTEVPVLEELRDVWLEVLVPEDDPLLA